MPTVSAVSSVLHHSFLALALMMFENACSSLTLLGVRLLWRVGDDTVWPTQQRAGG
jgi:hypothetical protein